MKSNLTIFSFLIHVSCPIVNYSLVWSPANDIKILGLQMKNLRPCVNIIFCLILVKLWPHCTYSFSRFRGGLFGNNISFLSYVELHTSVHVFSCVCILYILLD